MQRARHRRRRRAFSLGFEIQWIVAILAPSGKGLPLAGIPCLQASIITGFPRIAATTTGSSLVSLAARCVYLNRTQRGDGQSQYASGMSGVYCTMLSVSSDTRWQSLLRRRYMLAVIYLSPSGWPSLRRRIASFRRLALVSSRLADWIQPMYCRRCEGVRPSKYRHAAGCFLNAA